MLKRFQPAMCAALVLLGVCTCALSQETLTPRQRHARERLAEELEKLQASGVCPTCSGTGVTTAATPESRVRRGEEPTRPVLCPTCLGTGLSGIEKLRGIMRRAIIRVRSSYGDAIGEADARDAMNKIFYAQALLLQDDLFDKVREELGRGGLWTLDAREQAVRAGVDPIKVDIAVTMKRLEREIDSYRRKHPMPIVFKRAAGGEILLEDGEVVPKEKSALPTEVRLEVFSLGEVGRVAKQFRETVAGALMLRYSFVAEPAPQAPAAEDGTGEAPAK